MPLRVTVIMGTRPEGVKLAPVVRELLRFPEQFTVRLVTTGQHREMLDQVLAVFDLRPDDDLAIMTPRQTLTEVTTRALTGIDRLLQEHPTDVVLVQGDTTTVFAASLAAFYHHTAVAHVEAGLRTDDKYQPFPEEINRRLTSALTDLHFAPTAIAKANLEREGISPDRICVTGNTVTDALQWAVESTRGGDAPEPAPTAGRLLVVTAHRRENWGEPLHRICRAVATLVRRYPDLEAVYAVHRNPVVREVADRELGGRERIHLIDPPDYLPFVRLMKRATLILTDSGGVQEEAPTLGVPVLVLRETTERPEAIAAGVARLVGTDEGAIVAAASELLDDPAAYRRMAQGANPYGDGQASRRIREALQFHFAGVGVPPDEFRAPSATGEVGDGPTS